MTQETSNLEPVVEAGFKTAYVSVVDGKAHHHHNVVQAYVHALNKLLEQPPLNQWLEKTPDDHAADRALYNRLRNALEAGETVTHEGRTAAIYPLDTVDHWAAEGRSEVRGGWDDYGGGVPVIGLDSEDEDEDADWQAPLAALGYEVATTLEALPVDTLDPVDLTAWRPVPPEGDGWVLHNAFQNDDELLAHWIRPEVRP